MSSVGARQQRLILRDRTWGRVECALGAAITVLVVLLHASVFTHAGALWRDEVNGVNVAALSGVVDIFRMHQYDSSFILWYLLVRGWAALFGWADLSLRGFGLVVGLAGVATLWWAGRELGRGVPLISIAAYGLNATALFYGDSIRGYGCSALFFLMTIVMVWRWMRQPTTPRLVGAVLTVVLGVHVMYQNAVLLLGLCIGAAAAGLALRDLRRTLWPLGMGAIAAASMLPYLVTVGEMGTWIELIREPHRSSNPLMYLPLRPRHPRDIEVWTWLGLLLAAVAATLPSLWSRGRATAERPAEPEPAWLVAAGLPIGLVAYGFAVMRVGYFGPPWHFIPLLAFVAVLCDAAVQRLCAKHSVVRPVRLAVVATLVVLLLPQAWSAARMRHTNVDLVAQRVQSEAESDDLVIVYGWHSGISFNRYYRGQAPWSTVPPLEDHDLHRWDQVRQRLAEPDPMGPLLLQLRRTIEAGHRAYVVLSSVPPKEVHPDIDYLPPAPNRHWGWQEQPYLLKWSRAVMATAAEFSIRAEQIPPSWQRIHPDEQLVLLIVTRSPDAAG